MGSRGRNERTSGFYVVGERVLSYLYTPRPVRFSFYVMRLGLACRLLCVSLYLLSRLYPSSLLSSHRPMASLCLRFLSISRDKSLRTAVSCLSSVVPRCSCRLRRFSVAPRSTGLVLDAVSLLLVCRSPLWVAERCALWVVSARVRARWARGAVCDVAIIYAYVPTLSCT